MEEKRYMIYHYLYPLNFKANVASKLRPVKMLSAFKQAGYEVIEITGYSMDRIKKIKQVKGEIKKGKKIDFIYSESTTMPTALTDPHHLPFHPFVDFNFFSFCKKRNIPIGLFYRDIYWKFPEYEQKIGRLKAEYAKIFYRYDISSYAKLLKKLYMPSKEMAKYIGKFPDIIDELFPGCDVVNLDISKEINIQNKQNINLLYVGGIISHYSLHLLFRTIAEKNRFSLTICTRKDEWEMHHSEYIKNNKMPSNINVVHFSGDEIKGLYEKADIAVLFVQPHIYWTFAVPFKLFEYIGYNKPILAAEGAYAGSYVKKQDIGWSIPYNEEALNNFLSTITYDEITIKGRNIPQLAAHVTWIDRARKVIFDMLG